MSTYNPAPSAAVTLLKDVMTDYPEHKQLVDEGITIDFLFAFPKEKADGSLGDAIKHHGVKCIGLIKRTGIKERTLGHADVLLLVDGSWWNTATEPEQRALLDHELYHVDIKRDDTFAVERDDVGRCKITMRPHDYEMGEFILIAKRHGKASQECKLMARIMEDSGQYFWPDMMHDGLPVPSDAQLVRAIDTHFGNDATVTATLPHAAAAGVTVLNGDFTETQLPAPAPKTRRKKEAET